MNTMEGTANDPQPQAKYLIQGTGLLDKYGYSNGDLLYEPVRYWAYTSWPAAILPSHNYNHPAWAYLDGRRALIFIVTTELLPKLDPQLSAHVATESGTHNPLRIWAPPGQHYVDWEHRARIQLERIEVTVPYGTIAQACTRLFPKRSLPWLKLHSILSSQFRIMGELTHTRGPLSLWREPAIALTDRIHGRLGTGGASLLSELLETRGDSAREDPTTLEDLDNLVRAVQACNT